MYECTSKFSTSSLKIRTSIHTFVACIKSLKRASTKLFFSLLQQSSLFKELLICVCEKKKQQVIAFYNRFPLFLCSIFIFICSGATCINGKTHNKFIIFACFWRITILTKVHSLSNQLSLKRRILHLIHGIHI